MTTETVRLTEMVACAGCAAKLGPAVLSAAVKGLFEKCAVDPNVIVGFGTLDDAGVYKISDTQALAQTVDFITPLVDDPFTYGEIAVTNAISDVYAMGGLPITALNVVCFPSGRSPDILREILAGGLAKMQEAGVALLGGHTVDDPEIKFGAAVTGLIDPRRVLTNAGARVGDHLVLTKPLGTGIITTGIKQAVAPPEAMEHAIRSMRTLNLAARNAVVEAGVNACTDVTGFSLMGHLHHMVRASHVTAVVHARRVPALTGALELARAGVFPGGAIRNRDHFGVDVEIDQGIEEELVHLLFDPQTSGGLLVAVPGNTVQGLMGGLTANGVPAADIGEIVAHSPGRIMVVAD